MILGGCVSLIEMFMHLNHRQAHHLNILNLLSLENCKRSTVLDGRTSMFLLLKMNAFGASLLTCYSIRNHSRQQFLNSRIRSISMSRCFVGIFWSIACLSFLRRVYISCSIGFGVSDFQSAQICYCRSHVFVFKEVVGFSFTWCLSKFNSRYEGLMVIEKSCWNR